MTSFKKYIEQFACFLTCCRIFDGHKVLKNKLDNKICVSSFFLPKPYTLSDLHYYIIFQDPELFSYP